MNDAETSADPIGFYWRKRPSEFWPMVETLPKKFVFSPRCFLVLTSARFLFWRLGGWRWGFLSFRIFSPFRRSLDTINSHITTGHWIFFCFNMSAPWLELKESHLTNVLQKGLKVLNFIFPVFQGVSKFVPMVDFFLENWWGFRFKIFFECNLPILEEMLNILNTLHCDYRMKIPPNFNCSSAQ